MSCQWFCSPTPTWRDQMSGREKWLRESVIYLCKIDSKKQLLLHGHNSLMPWVTQTKKTN